MTVLANTAEFGHEIDVGRAQRAKDQAEKIMAGLGLEDKTFKIAEAALHRALVRLQVAIKDARR
jgi:F-type H+-transporting ATPase subunit epsilon